MSEDEQEHPEKVWTRKLLLAARSDILEGLRYAEVSPELAGRDFGGVLFVAKYAEEIAGAEGRTDFNSVLQHVLAACEFNKNAKHLYAAIVAHFANGNVVLYDKYRRLQSTHREVEASRQALNAAHQHVAAEREHIAAERVALNTLREALQLRDDNTMPEMPALPPMSEIVRNDE